MRQQIDPYSAIAETYEALTGDGLFLMTGSVGNPMTIGWGTIGPIWDQPVFVILVRPSRYSFELLDEVHEFTVNVPKPEHSKALAVCGTKSGRDIDKLDECWLTAVKSESVQVPYIAECPIHYECRVVHRNDLLSAELDHAIAEKVYPKGDLHRLYYGNILGVYREG